MKAVLFDMDGVLVDTHRVHATALVEAAGAFGYRIGPIAPTDNRVSAEKLRSSGVPEGEIHRICLFKQNIYRGLAGRLIIPRLDIFQMLVDLRVAGYVLGIVSNCGTDAVQHGLSLAGLGELGLPIVAPAPGLRPKPAPDLYERALALLGLPRGAALAVEDTDDGILSAVDAGCVAMKVTYASVVKELESCKFL